MIEQQHAMEVMEQFRRDLAYNAWANSEALRALQGARAVPERAAAVMGHIVGAEWLWLRRLGHASVEMAVWPRLSLGECEEQLRELSQTWRAYVTGLTADLLRRGVAYTNSQGAHWTNQGSDILTHVVLHSSYHRGQIATLLGRAGQTAAYTDYIEYVRRGHAAPGW